MEATQKRKIQSGQQYKHLFPPAANSTATIRKDANVYHTVAFIPKVVNETLHQTKQIAQELKAKTIHETCSNIWHFVYRHIAYKKDEQGYEQIRSPARAWHDRFKGVDCDCYSVFISSILSNLKIPHTLRITKYHRDYFQHIYPIVPTASGYITIDCVTDKFNYEVPFSEKKDYPMDLQYLNGFDNNPALYADPNDAYFLSGDGMEELGKIIAGRFGNSSRKRLPKKVTTSNSGLPAPKKKKFFGKLLHAVNKINPATVLLRNGILASMKMNMRNVAGRLRWTYLTPEQAAKKGVDLQRWQKLVHVRQRLEKIFFGCGGKLKNLQAAILKGKGNRDKAVSGLGELGMVEYEDNGQLYFSYDMPLTQLLGTEIYHSENVEGMDGFGELGEPITMSAIAAAAGVIAGIVGLIKQVGDIFPKKGQGSKDFDEKTNEDADKDSPVTTDNTDDTKSPEEKAAETTTDVVKLARGLKPTASTDLPAESKDDPAAKNDAAATDDKTGADTKESFWDKNKKWMKPVAIGVGGLTVVAIGYHLMKGSGSASKAPPPKSKALAGSPKAKNHHRSKAGRKNIKSLPLL